MDTGAGRSDAWRRWRQLSAPFDWCSQARMPPLLWLCLLWFVLVVPAIGVQEVHYEEAATIGLARGAFEDGHWLTPFLYGVRFVERPVLISWLLGAVGLGLGYLPLWVARLPMVLALLAGAGLVYGVVRPYASRGAALWGASCFLLSPMMLQKTVTAEVDGIVSVLLFAGFVTWWRGHCRGRPTAARWLGITLLLAAASLVKGPQPLGYFFLGVGAYLLLQRRWRELSALALAGVLAGAGAGAWYGAVYQPGDGALWVTHARLAAPQSVAVYGAEASHFVVQLGLEWLPGVLLAAPLARTLVRRRLTEHRALALALCLYGGVCSALLVGWPHARTRYAMPSVLAIAAVAGLAYDEMRVQHRKSLAVAQGVAMCLLTYALVVHWLILPLTPSSIAQEKRPYADYIALTMAQHPGPFYITPEALDNQVLVYLKIPVHPVSFETLQRVEPPFFAVLSPAQEHLLRTFKGDCRLIRHLSLDRARGGRFIELLPP
jgi:4-amino-4-deoxy-L-arabinose transferase-like glycosyltransferase